MFETIMAKEKLANKRAHLGLCHVLFAPAPACAPPLLGPSFSLQTELSQRIQSDNPLLHTPVEDAAEDREIAIHGRGFE